MTRDDPLLRVRLPEELKATIQARASENRRSMNAEIVARLEQSLASEQDGGGGLKFIGTAKNIVVGDNHEERLKALENRLAAVEARIAKGTG